MSPEERRTHRSIARRQVLAAGGAAILTATAGCSTVLDFVGDRILEEVNILNQLNREISGSIEVVGPTGATLLDTAFTAPSTEADNESNIVAYSDVWTDAGSYAVSIVLTDIELEGVSQASREITIDDTEADMLAISIGSGDETEPIAFRVGESFSEFGQTSENGSQ
ncbi:hypothetical protein [Haloarchaeobius iranensis]|nr:hypothetical protein [Haloarchaeobius iranensis]